MRVFLFLFSRSLFFATETQAEKKKTMNICSSLSFSVRLFAECQALLLLRQPSEGPGGSKLAFGNEPGSAVGGQQQQAESRAGGSGSAR